MNTRALTWRSLILVLNDNLDGNSSLTKGCLSNLQLSPWGFKAFVLKDNYTEPTPVITKFAPGHDSRIVSTSSLPIELHFSVPMDCQQISNALRINSSTSSNQNARLDFHTVRCGNVSIFDDVKGSVAGMVMSSWVFSATVIDVDDGVHQISVGSISSAANSRITMRSTDHFLLRVGQINNPVTFPSANYSSNLLVRGRGDSLYLKHKAAGADLFRYSLNFGTTYSDWEEYPKGPNPMTNMAPKVWSGTNLQGWKGSHVTVQYWSRLVGSSDHVQQADLDFGGMERHIPHAFLEGIFNQHGFDSGFQNEMQMTDNNTWIFDFVHEWPAQVAINIWGINPE